MCLLRLVDVEDGRWRLIVVEGDAS